MWVSARNAYIYIVAYMVHNNFLLVSIVFDTKLRTSLSSPSRIAAHVKPADVVPTPVVITERGHNTDANRNT